MNGEQIIALAMKVRTERGLRVEWFIPSENRNFTVFPKDDAQKQAWMQKAAAQGWILQA